MIFVLEFLIFTGNNSKCTAG